MEIKIYLYPNFTQNQKVYVIMFSPLCLMEKGSHEVQYISSLTYLLCHYIKVKISPNFCDIFFFINGKRSAEMWKEL